MRRLRHPGLIHFIDGRETADKLFVVTEQVRPLSQILPSMKDGHPGERAFVLWFKKELSSSPVGALAWGLFQVGRALNFLNNDCNHVHGYVMIETIVVNRAYDWKLAGMELISDTSKKEQALEFHSTLLNDIYKPPELASNFWVSLCKSPRTYDAWLLGCLISQVFGGGSGSFRGESQLKDMTMIPTGLRDEYKDLLRPFQRRTMDNFKGSRYFKDDYVQSMYFLENIALKDEYEKDQFFKKLQPLIQALPVEVSRYKVLPELVKGLDYGTANFRVLGPILEIGNGMEDDEFLKFVGSSIIKWFQSPDRSLRRNLLENLQPIVDRMDKGNV